MRVIGFDPGLRRTGWGVVDSINGKLRLTSDTLIGTGDTVLRIVFF